MPAATQSFSGARPAWAASLAALLFLPALAHGIEFIVHWLAGTVLLRQSIAASVFFTVAATAFNLFAMRRNVLTVGRDSQSLIDDLRQLPGTILAFSTTLPRALLRLRAKERLAAMSAPAVAAAVETGQTDA